nr:hypothetical protein [uncultured Shinella sp.]
MQHFSSIVWFFLTPFAIGFFALCFWWRWWLLVPAAVAAAIFGKIEYDGVMTADGPGMALGIGLVVFLLIGGTSGALASAVVIAGRSLSIRLLSPLFVLPVVFLLGFGSYFALNWTEKKLHEARNASPSESCLSGLHPARLGSVELDIPIAPGLFLWGMGGRDDHYILWSNSHARAFCADTDDEPVALKKVSFMLDGMPSRRRTETQRPFCEKDHPEYPWADMACNLILDGVVPDSAVNVSVSIPTSTTDWVAKDRESMMTNPMTVAADGVKTYRGKNDLYLERPDGFFARCQAYDTPSRPWLYCSAGETLPEGLALSYEFRTTEKTFLLQSPKVAASAHAMFDSLRRRD